MLAPPTDLYACGTRAVTDDPGLLAAYVWGMFYMHGIGWGWWLLMSFGMVAFWGLVIWGIVTLVRGGSSGAEQPAVESDRPLDVLQRRLARGEISVEEYEELRDALIGRRGKSPA